MLDDFVRFCLPWSARLTAAACCADRLLRVEAKSLGELTTKVADGLDMGEAVSVCPVAPNVGSATAFGSLSEIKDKVRSYRDRKCLQHFLRLGETVRL